MMKKVLTALFVIAMVICSTQTFRHVYVKFFDSHESVLDEFRSETESNIKDANNLSELVTLYRTAEEEVQAYEADSSNPIIVRHEQSITAPYKNALKIETEIKNREHDQRQMNKLFFYWGFGFISLFLGLFTFKVFNEWLGISVIITGFSEMLAWTSPLFHNRMMSVQFVQLLDYKLLLSLITWVILASAWIYLGKLKQFKSNN